jgi:hypothetical protein
VEARDQVCVSEHGGRAGSTVIVYSSIMIENRPESVRSSRFTR